MWYIFLSIFLLIFQSALIYSANINIYPEFFFLPWLISKGFVPYRDFFDHHGFLIYYLLTPLSLYKSLLGIKRSYFLIQSLNLTLFLIILRKTTFKINFLIGGFLYVLLNFFFSENSLWYENVITTFFLIIFLISIGKNLKYKIPFLALCIGFASFIKPTAMLIIFPVFLYTENPFVFIYFLIPWLFVYCYFFIQKSLYPLITDIFLFNSYYAKYFINHFYFNINFKLILSILIIFLLSVLLHLIYHKHNKKATFVFLYTLISANFIFPSFIKANLTPFIPFFIWYVFYIIKGANKTVKIFFLSILFLYIILLFKKDLQHISYLKHSRTPYIENKHSSEIVSALQKLDYKDSRIYVWGNQVEIYYLLNKIPPVKTFIVFPWISDYFKNIESEMIYGIKKNKVELIIVPQPFDPNYRGLTHLEKYIKTNYIISLKTKDYVLYISASKNY